MSKFVHDAKTQLEQLREEIQRRIAGLDAGRGIEIDSEEELAAFFEEIESEVRREAGK